MILCKRVVLLIIMSGLVCQIPAVRKKKANLKDAMFCENFIGPVRNIEMYEGSSALVLAWDRPEGTKACNVTYRLLVTVDSAAVVNERIASENYPLVHNFEEDYCSVIEVIVQAISHSRAKSETASEQFLIGTPKSCDTDKDDESEEGAEVKERILEDSFEERANVEMNLLFDADDRKRRLIK